MVKLPDDENSWNSSCVILFSKSDIFSGGRGEHIVHMLSGQQRGNEGSFHEQFHGVMSSVRIVQLE